MADSGTALAIRQADISKHLTKDDKRYIDDAESKLGTLRTTRASEERKAARLWRTIEATKEYQDWKRCQQRIAGLKKIDAELCTKVSGVLDKALQDVPGESMLDKYEHLSGGKR